MNKKYVWRFFECGLEISKKCFIDHCTYGDEVYNEMKNTDGECFWSDSVYDVFKDYE